MRRRLLWLLFTLGFLGGAMGRCTLDPVYAQALPATFNGATWQDAGQCAELDDTRYTVCARLTNAAAASSSSRVAYAAASGTLTDQYAYLGINNNLLPECTYRSSAGFSVKSPTAIGSGEHTIFCVADGASLSLYVDGIFRASTTLATAQTSPRALCTIGALRRGPSAVGNYWDGHIAAVQVWDRALTATEVAAGCADVPPPVVENCHGHTGLQWDAYTDERVTRFVVERQIQGTPESWSQQGDTAFCNRAAWTDEDGVDHPAVRCERWPLLMAGALPREGVVYEYRVRAATADGQLSEPSNVMVCGRQDPTSCYHSGILEPCP